MALRASSPTARRMGRVVIVAGISAEAYPSTTTPAALGFVNAPHLLQSITPERVAAINGRLALLDRDELLHRFQANFFVGKRKLSFLLAEELTRRGIPPCFRHNLHTRTDYTLDQKFTLMLDDFRWLRREHSEHVKQVRYARYRELFSQSESKFHRAAEYVFWQGRRPAWKMVASLSLTESQQLDCFWLRSAPVAKRHAQTQALSEHVFNALEDDLKHTRRTTAFTDDDAAAALARRHALWVCAQITGGGPTAMAARYIQMTGSPITRQTAGKQLEKIVEVLRKNEARKGAQSEQETV